MQFIWYHTLQVMLQDLEEIAGCVCNWTNKGYISRSPLKGCVWDAADKLLFDVGKGSWDMSSAGIGPASLILVYV